MSETLRSQIDQPAFFGEREAKNSVKGSQLASAYLQENSARPLVLTQDHEDIAYDVAHAVNSEVDHVARLSEKSTEHHADGNSIVADANGRVIGRQPFSQGGELLAAKADLERNTRKAAEIAAGQRLGPAALEMAQSKQKVAEMKLG